MRIVEEIILLMLDTEERDLSTGMLEHPRNVAIAGAVLTEAACGFCPGDGRHLHRRGGPDGSGGRHGTAVPRTGAFSGPHERIRGFAGQLRLPAVLFLNQPFADHSTQRRAE